MNKKRKIIVLSGAALSIDVLRIVVSLIFFNGSGEKAKER